MLPIVIDSAAHRPRRQQSWGEAEEMEAETRQVPSRPASGQKGMADGSRIPGAVAVLTLYLASVAAFAAEPHVRRDIPYVEPSNERQTLDVYWPVEGSFHPMVVWVHGGAWRIGSKNAMQRKPQAFVEQGYVFVAINYRFVPEASIQEIASDVAKAIAWTHRHAQDYGGDPHTIFVMGHSAGAQLAALVGTDERYLQAEGLTLKLLKGCVAVDGNTYDVAKQVEMTESMQTRPYFDSHRRLFGHEAMQRELSAVNHVAPGKGIPPFLILHVADFNPRTRTGLQAQFLRAALMEKGEVSAKVVAIANKTHATINADIGIPGDPTTEAVFGFVRESLQSAPAPAYTTYRVADHVKAIAQSPYVSPTASSNQHLVFGKSRGWPQDPEIPPHDLFAYKITAPAAQGNNRVKVIITGGTHNTEFTGSWALQGAVDLLLSDDPRAALLRRRAEFYVYPMVNPDGRYTLRGRGNPEIAVHGHTDHNRIWNTEGVSTSADAHKAAMRRDPGGPVTYLFDFHSTYASKLHVHQSISESPFVRALFEREPNLGINIRPGSVGGMRFWSSSPEGLNIPLAFTPELGHSETAERAMEIGRNYLLALHDVLSESATDGGPR